MIETDDVYTAINDGGGWPTISYMISKIEQRGIHIRRAAFRELWTEANQTDRAPVVRDAIIDTRGDLHDVYPCNTKTTRQVMRGSEDGPSDEYIRGRD